MRLGNASRDAAPSGCGFSGASIDCSRMFTVFRPSLPTGTLGWPANQPNAKAFVAWLKKHKDGKKLVLGASRNPTPLWQLFEVVSTRKVAVPYDVTKLWFSE